MNKKAMKWMDAWGETWTLIFLVLGLLISLMVGSKVVNFLVIFVSGISVGRLHHIRKHRLGFPFFLIIFGYLVGFVIGSLIRDMGNWIALLFVFGIGCWVGDYIIEKKYCK